MDRFRFPNKYFKMTSKGKDMADRTGSVVLPITYTVYRPDFVGKNHMDHRNKGVSTVSP